MQTETVWKGDDNYKDKAFLSPRYLKDFKLEQDYQHEMATLTECAACCLCFNVAFCSMGKPTPALSEVRKQLGKKRCSTAQSSRLHRARGGKSLRTSQSVLMMHEQLAIVNPRQTLSENCGKMTQPLQRSVLPLTSNCIDKSRREEGRTESRTRLDWFEA